jgi:hypothetical protein
VSVDPVSALVTVGLNLASMALTASQHFEGPRLDSLKVTNASFGAGLKYFQGTRMLEGLSVIYAEDLREEEHENKTKGGKYNSFKYFGTFATMIADHQIDAVLMVLFDEHIVYNATGSGPVSPFSVDGGRSITDFMRFYLGTDDQEPDPRQLATIEARDGPGTCPAYPNVSYIQVEELPLEKLGNRNPQVKVLASRNASLHYPYEVFASPIAQPERLWGFTFSPDGSRAFYGTFGNYALWDVAARSLMQSGTMGGSVNQVQKVFGWARDGRLYYAGDEETLGGDIHSMFGGESYSTAGLAFGAESCTVKSLGVGYPEFLVAYPQITTELFAWLRLKPKGDLAPPEFTYVNTAALVGTGFTVTTAFVDENGDLWVGGAKMPGTVTTAYFMRVTALGAVLGTPTLISVTGLPGLIDPEVSALWCDGAIVMKWDPTGGLYQINPASGAILTSIVPFTTDVYNTAKQFEAFVPGQKRLWLNSTRYALEIDLTNLTLVRTIDTMLWSATDAADGIIYDRINHALITAPDLTDQELAWRYLDRATGSGVLLQDIIEMVSEMSGMDVANDIDASAMNQVVLGHSFTQATGRSILEPLLEFHASLMRPHDFKLQFIKRGGSGVGEIPVEEMGADGGKRYIVTPTSDSDLPRRASMTFADPAIDQQQNTALSQRNAAAIDGARELSLDLSNFACTADAARAGLDAYLRRVWYNSTTIDNAVTRMFTALEPGDHKSLDLDGEAETGELVRLTITAGGVLACNWRRDLATVHVLPTQPGAPAVGVTPPVVVVFGISKGFGLDIPLTRDADNGTNPLLYYGAGPYSDAAWPGATMLRSDDGLAFDETFANVPSAAILTWGYANGALATASANVWDRGNTVSVTVKSGSLTSQSEAAIDANPQLNQALLGNEILQFSSVTLVSSDSSGKVYTLQGFKRGRRGTEVFVGTHAAGEQFVLVDQLGHEELGASDIGDAVYLKGVTQGRDPATADVITLTYAANSHKPYAPCLLGALKDPSTGDWALSCRRRSRIGYRWTGGSTVPLGEAVEAYEWDIMNGASVVRTISSSTPAATWTAAMQTTDFGSGQSTVSYRVRQIGDLVDGREAAATF